MAVCRCKILTYEQLTNSKGRADNRTCGQTVGRHEYCNITNKFDDPCVVAGMSGAYDLTDSMTDCLDFSHLFESWTPK